MSYTVSITSQGQISIPAKIRKNLGLNKNTKAFLTEEKGKLIVEPVKDFLELIGSLKTNKKPLTDRQMDEIIAQAVAGEYEEKLKRQQ